MYEPLTKSFFTENMNTKFKVIFDEASQAESRIG